ncbi:MAG: hypothetical protein ACKOX3_00040 [Bacteroidota bacterium]
MKKIIALSLLACTMSVHAQSVLLSKSGKPILPEKGDFALNIDAVPFINFTGNLLNGSTNSSPEFLFTQKHPMTLSGMYLKDNETAYRMKVRLGLSSFKNDTTVAKNGSTNPNELVVDESIRKTSAITLGFGIQKWRGDGRVRAYYGGEVLYGVKTDKTTYTYGNALSNENQVTRNTLYKPGNTIEFSIRGFIGIEYFFAPRMSISGEFGWGPSVQTRKAGELVREKWNGGAVEEIKTATGKSSLFAIDNDNNGGALNLNIYF